MNKIFLVTPLLMLALISTTGFAATNRVTDPNLPHALPAQGPVSVSWSDPSQFTDIRSSPNRWEAERGTWVQDLAAYMRKAAAKELQPGQTLEVHFTDMDRAGEYEPWHGPAADDIRIMKDIYPPRLTFDFTLKDANGQVIDQGHRQLTDLAYLMNARPMDTDPLRYEKQMIDQWAYRELDSKQRRLSSNP